MLVGPGLTYVRRPTDQPNFLLMFGNLFSNFYEEYIYRGTLLAILMKYLGNKSVAITISALVFCQGHLHFPLPLLLVVFLAGVLWEQWCSGIRISGPLG